MSTSSRVPAAITAAVTAFAAVTPTAVEVLRGRQQATGGDQGQRVYVGWSGDDADRVAADFDHAYRGLGAGRITETFTVRCCVIAWSGDDDPDALAVLEGAAFDILAPVQAEVRRQMTVPGSPFGLPLPCTVRLAAGQLIYDGVTRVRIPFGLNITTRI